MRLIIIIMSPLLNKGVENAALNTFFELTITLYLFSYYYGIFDITSSQAKCMHNAF